MWVMLHTLPYVYYVAIVNPLCLSKSQYFISVIPNSELQYRAIIKRKCDDYVYVKGDYQHNTFYNVAKVSMLFLMYD